MHSYILKKDPPPKCEHCQCILTFRHILVECNQFAEKMGEMLWNHLDSTPHSLYLIYKNVSFIISFNLYLSGKLFLHSSLHCDYNLVNF